jgi:hypothetical protein
MTGRALLVGILFIGLGLAGLTSPVDAQSDIEQDDLSTGEISEESSSTDLGSDDTSPEEELSDDPLWPNRGDKDIPRPRTPLETDH